MDDIKKIFVYGTLKVNGRYAKMFDKVRSSVKKGFVTGTLFNIRGAFPGLILKGDTLVFGEVHEFTEDIEPQLDRIEGFFGHNNPKNLYNKDIVEVVTEEGIVETCKVYTFAQDTSTYKTVDSGFWEI